MEDKLRKLTSWLLVTGMTMVLVPGAAQAVAPSTETIPPCEDVLDPCRIVGQTEIGGDCNGYVDVDCTCDDPDTNRCDEGDDCLVYWHPLSPGCIVG